ncbi:MAG: hypothetical protein OXH39_23215 [Candidatus Poribacteria bacterium]|nr:hypothetical protein [Candidatus Poribacteria bacterium]
MNQQECKNQANIEICEKVRRTTYELYKSIDLPECSDKIAEIERTIKVIKEHVKSLKPDNSKFSMNTRQYFQQVVDLLLEAKSVLESEETDDYGQLIWNACELSHSMEVREKNRTLK